MPRAATTARSSSVSKNSETRSATAIGPHRRSRNASRRGSARNLRPTPRSSHISPIDGSSIEGGVIVRNGAEHLADPAEALVEGEVALRVVGRDLLDRAGGGLRIGGQSDGPSVERRREDPGLRLDEREAVAREIEVAGDRRQERPRGVEERRGAEPGSELLGDRDPADDLAPLEDGDLEACLREVRGGGQAVGPAADDDDVLRFRHRPRPSPASSPRGACPRRSSRWRP